MKKYILTVATGLALTAGNAFASEPLMLSEAQMDNVSAGASVTINQSGAALGIAAVAGVSDVLGISFGGFAVAIGSGRTGGRAALLGSFATSNQVVALP